MMTPGPLCWSGSFPPLLSLWIPMQMFEPTRSQTGGEKKGEETQTQHTRTQQTTNTTTISTAQGPGSLMGVS